MPATSIAPPGGRAVLWTGADPWVIRHDGFYYSCQSGEGGQIEVWKSDDLLRHGRRAVVWRPPQWGWNRDQIWAPELHRVGGRWYIYYAGSDGLNANHRMGVLESTSDDPQGRFVEKAVLYTGDHFDQQTSNRWAIDGTVLQLHGKLYFIWSGWEDDRDIQYLYIAPMANPWTMSGNRVRLCNNDDYLWERVGEQPEQRGLHEGPQVLLRHGKVFLIYSCSGSWQSTYKLALLHMDQQANPLQAANWTKHPHPLFASSADIFGVGHGSFTTSPDGLEDWLLYHSKVQRSPGWERVVRAQRFRWNIDGFPNLGRPGEMALAPMVL